MNKKLKSYFYNHFYRHFYNFFYQYYFIFFIHGFFTIIAQLVFVRELLACFYGNELFSGLVLGCWFLSAGLGSFLALKLAKIKALKTIIILQILMVLTLPLEIYILRWLIGKTTNFGQQPSITLSLLIIFILIFPFSFVLNAIFSWTTNLLNKKGQQTVAKIINISYLIETLGLVFGGLVFNFFLINTTFPFNSNLNKASLKFRFPNLIETTNSVYGNIVVTKENNQYSFYENGQFVYHNQEIENNESLAHLILIQHAKPENILIIGNGLNGLIDQVIKYPSILTIDYLNLDPKLTSISRKYLPDWLNQSLNDPRVKIIPIDGRTFLNQNNKKYDIIIFNLPNPSTSLINRFYSLESFQLVEKSLKANGIFSTLLTVPVDYQSQEAINLSSLIIQTLKSVFPYQLLLPEDNTILILNAKNNLLSQNSKNLTKRFKDYHIETDFFSADYLNYRLTNPQINQIKTNLNNNQLKTINTDLKPTAYFLESAFWQTMFSFKSAKIFSTIALIDFKAFLIITIIINLLIFSLIKKSHQLSFLLVSFSSFILFSWEIVFIFAFQARFGNIYTKIALIFTTILLFFGLGNFLITKKKLSLNKIVQLIKLIFGLVFIYGISCLIIIKKINLEWQFYLLAAVLSFILGTVFPLTNLFLSHKNKNMFNNTGFLYSADLIGALIGSVASSLFLIPIFGAVKTILLLSLLSLFISLLLQKKLGQ